jgi:outer membrane protein assembly factor BamB
LLVLVSLSAFFQAADADLNPADNWHQWRGPEASGFAPKADPPLKWDDKTNVRWKTPIPGRGSSTPIVWGDQIFILTVIDTGKQADAKDIPKPDPKFEKDKKTQAPTTYHQFVVCCIDRKTGNVIWQQTATEAVPHEGHHETHSYAAFSPITDGKYLYVSFGSQGVYCYDRGGMLQWQRQDLGRMETRYGWGEGASPVLYRDTLFVNWDHEGQSFLTALDGRTGKTKWKVDRDEVTSWSTPLVIERDGKGQVIVNAAKRVRSYDPATGKIIWECGGQTINVIPSPVRVDDLVVCVSGYRGAFAAGIPLASNGDVTGKTAWQFDRGTPYVPSPVLAGGRLYFTQMNTGMLTCLDAKTGKVIFEKERLPGLTSLYASPVAAKDRIYFTGRDGTVVVIKRSDKLAVLATNRLGEGIDASPALVGKELFLRGEKHLYCIAGN